MRRKNQIFIPVIALIFIQSQTAWALEPANLLKKDAERCGAAASAETLSSSQASQEAMIESKNTVQSLSDQPQTQQPLASSALMEAFASPAQQVGMNGGSS